MGMEDETAIAELISMARVYMSHGDLERAEKVMELAQQMQARISRSYQLNEMQSWSTQAHSEQMGA